MWSSACIIWNAIKGELLKPTELDSHGWLENDDLVHIRILYPPRDRTGGHDGGTADAPWRSQTARAKRRPECLFASIRHLFARFYSHANPIPTANNFNLKTRSFVSRSNLFSSGFYVFFPSPCGRCVMVGGSCRTEHRLLSDSPCSWHLCYPHESFHWQCFHFYLLHV